MKVRTTTAGLLSLTLVLVALPARASGDEQAAGDQHAAPAELAAPAEHAAGGEHGSGAAHEEPSIFAGGIGNAVLTLVIFGIVVFYLGKYAWPALIRVLDEREQTIRKSLEEAKQEREQAKALLDRYQAQLDRARQEAFTIVEEGRRDAGTVRLRIQAEARQEADEMIARAKREIRLATDTAVKEIYDRFAELAVDVAAGILRRELDAAAHKQLIDESLRRIEARANGDEAALAGAATK